MNNISISSLKNKWHTENNAYRTQELGSGVHSFVRNLFECALLFNLKEGAITTDILHRKNEYIHEKKAKEGRKADFYIFINQDIAIPVEAECYGNIKAGETQLANYQRDFNKKYGILTDGHTWRFYNNQYIIREFTIDKILDQPKLFLAFWHEYIKPEGYYLSFFEKQGQLNLFEDQDVIFVEDNRIAFFEDITQLIKNFKNKLKIEGYLDSSSEKSKEERAIEITYAYIIQFILYKTLVDNFFGDFPDEFKSLVEIIYKNLKKQSYKEILGLISRISAKISENIYRPFNKEQKLIDSHIHKLFTSLENTLSDVSPWLDIFIFIRSYNFSNVRNDIFGYIYENYLKEIYEETNRGQYYTDPNVVNFMLKQIGFTPNIITKRYKADKNSISIIDPACGSGTFLYSSTDNIVEAFKNGYSEEASKIIEEAITNNIFGLDIAEFPLYLAEMSVLMRLLPLIVHKKYNNRFENKIKVFKTRDSISEFLDTGLKFTLSQIRENFDRNIGQMDLFDQDLNLGYESYVRDEDDLLELKKSVENQNDIQRRRFDFVIGNPPYIGYNACSTQGLLIIKKIQNGDIQLSDIYGINLHSVPGNPKKAPPKPNLYSFFIALGIALLKDNGKLCYIVPQTLLTARDLDVLRYHIAKYTILEKIIVFSGKMFVGRGLGQDRPIPTSSLIFILSRGIPNDEKKVDVIYYESPDDEIKTCLENIIRKKNTKELSVYQKDLLINYKNWNYLISDEKFINFYAKYQENSEDISTYYHHPSAQYTFNTNFIFDIGYNIDEKKLLSQPPKEGNYYKYPKLTEEYYGVNEFRGYWPDIRQENNDYHIGLLKANQSYRLLDTKFKVVWSYQNPQKFHFSDNKVIWARNQICAIGSDNKDEIIYLFALLNSKVNNKILLTLLKSSNEKALLIAVASIKNFIRVPKISEKNIFIKEKIIQNTYELLAIEDVKLDDCVDFSDVLVQSFSKVEVNNNKLILESDKQTLKLQIHKEYEYVKKAIFDLKGNLLFDINHQSYDLSELKSLHVIDFPKLQEKKDIIDYLVFALYFDIKISKENFEFFYEIKKLCQESDYYNLL